MRRDRSARILIWVGVGLLVVGLMLSIPRLALYASTYAYTRLIPTPPPLPEISIPSATATVLLPFEEGVPEESPTATATPEITPAPVQATLGPSPTLPPVQATLGPSPTLPPAQATVAPSPTLSPGPTASLPTATPTDVWQGLEPVAIRIPAIRLDAPIVPIGWKVVESSGVQQAVWDVPNYRAAGWHKTSAYIGVAGNTVLNGHNATKGEVFRDLYRLEVGALLLIDTSDGDTYAYRVGEKYILREAGQPLEVRIQNARYIQPTDDERITLVTCHPYGSLANRLLIIAYPAPQPEDVPIQGE